MCIEIIFKLKITKKNVYKIVRNGVLSLFTINTFSKMCSKYFAIIRLAVNQNNNTSIVIQIVFDILWQHFIHLLTMCRIKIISLKIRYFPFVSHFLECIVEFTRGYILSISQQIKHGSRPKNPAVF